MQNKSKINQKYYISPRIIKQIVLTVSILFTCLIFLGLIYFIQRYKQPIKSSFNQTLSPTLKEQNKTELINKVLFKLGQGVGTKADLENLLQKRKADKQFVNPLWSLDQDEISKIVKDMSLEDQVGQLFMTGLNDFTLDDTLLKELAKFAPGGIIYMGDNIKNKEQLITLSESVQKTNVKIPLFISTDQEGGEVQRIKWDDRVGAGNWEKLQDSELCQMAKASSTVLQSSGINTNLSPVSDISNTNKAFINNRTVSHDPKVVTSKIKTYLSCFNIFSTLKHFPGHGMVTGDSHLVIPNNPLITKSEWIITHAKPFQNNLNSDFIMSGHFVISAVDQKPASMSKIWLTDILKGELGYKGLVITDDMVQYSNISGKVGTELNKASLEALQAGNDMLLFVPSFNNFIDVKLFLIEYYKDHKGELENKVLKILELKSKIY
jgi:beta-N-acetylhexosaminidase